MNFGTIQVADIFVGALNAVEAYFGAEKVWEQSAPLGDWLCFTAEEANSTVAMAAAGSAPTVSLECSTDGDTWSPFEVGTTTVTLANIGDKVYVRATSAGNTGLATSTSNYNTFVMTGKIASSGNVDTLLDRSGNATLTNYCYNSMFYGCSSLTTAPSLPATTLANYCYNSMFRGCTSLTTAPSLPATTLTINCYTSMFYGCSSLTTAPSLPAETLTGNCYSGMFYNCTSLTTAPALPATTLVGSCYTNMFRGCTSLTQAPVLPATTLATGCYNGMFRSCSNLNSITLGYTGNFADAPTSAFSNWVNAVAASGTFYYNGSDTTTGVNAIPSGWTVVKNSTKVKYTSASGLSDLESDIVGSISGSIRISSGRTTATKTSQIANVVSAEQIDVGAHVTNIATAAFASCSSLSSVVVPPTTNVDSDAFYGSSVMSLTMIGRTTTDVQNMSGWSSQTKYYSGGYLTTQKFSLPSGCVIHCTDGDITI